MDRKIRPAEAFLAKSDGSNERKLTTFSDPWLSDVAIVPPEQLTWKVADGTTIEGWLVKPLNYTPGKNYPLVRKIHGGPHGAYGTGWFDTFQILAGSGMFVLYPNPRGSTGYGHKFTYATRGKWGEMDQEDSSNSSASHGNSASSIDDCRRSRMSRT